MPCDHGAHGPAQRHGVNRTGKFQTWVCLTCGYTEFYAHDLGDLAQIEQAVSPWSDQMRIVDATAPQKGSYR
ncbi:hypothetical protein ACMHYB_23560 [Sorangium sp. So ce1128]